MAPNVVTIVLDDLGFAQLGCFGADIATPAIDRSAAGDRRDDRSTSPAGRRTCTMIERLPEPHEPARCDR